MKKYLVLLWLLLPLPVVVMHFGRGQQWLALDKASDLIKQAGIAEQQEDWARAEDLYREAAKGIGSDDPALKMRLDLAQVRTRYGMCDAAASIDMIDKLLDDPGLAAMPAGFHSEARELAGRIHYYAAWVMRLEGASRDLWMEQAEAARQNFRLLAEQDAATSTGPNNKGPSTGPSTAVGTATTKSSGGKSAMDKQLEDLESAVQLQRLSMTELMARPLPREGQKMGGQGLTEQMGKKRGQRGKGNQPGPGKQDGPPDKGAGSDRFQPGSGS